MEIFRWIRQLLQQLKDWLIQSIQEVAFPNDVVTFLGKDVAIFLDELMCTLQRVWDSIIAPALISSFGQVTILYVIFYAGNALGETIMEIWDPRYYDSKPSQVFNLKQAPQNTPLPTSRSAAKVLTLENWY